MPTYTFTGPRLVAERTGACPTCGKRVKRTRTFECTVNPFNCREDGTPKTWAEVREDVKAEAEAWTPDKSEFEHDKCAAKRLAPEPAVPVTLTTEQIGRAVDFRRVMDRTLLWLTDAGLPCGHVEITRRDDMRGERYLVDFGFVRPGHVALWARALGVEQVPVEDGGHATYVRIRTDVDNLVWRVHASISKPDLGDRLGGAPVEWHRDERGRKTGRGTVALDELVAGLARMGIAEVTLPEPVAG